MFRAAAVLHWRERRLLPSCVTTCPYCRVPSSTDPIALCFSKQNNCAWSNSLLAEPGKIDTSFQEANRGCANWSGSTSVISPLCFPENSWIKVLIREDVESKQSGYFSKQIGGSAARSFWYLFGSDRILLMTSRLRRWV